MKSPFGATRPVPSTQHRRPQPTHGDGGGLTRLVRAAGLTLGKGHSATHTMTIGGQKATIKAEADVTMRYGGKTLNVGLSNHGGRVTVQDKYVAISDDHLLRTATLALDDLARAKANAKGQLKLEVPIEAYKVGVSIPPYKTRAAQTAASATVKANVMPTGLGATVSVEVETKGPGGTKLSATLAIDANAVSEHDGGDKTSSRSAVLVYGALLVAALAALVAVGTYAKIAQGPRQY